MSRISFFSRFENPKQILLENSQELNETIRTISSGKKVSRPSDDPTATVRILRFRDQLENLEQSSKNITSGQNFLENSEGVLSEVTGVLQRARELASRGANDSLDEDSRGNIADEVNQRLEELVDLANSKVGDRYLFAGAETGGDGQAPFSVRRNGQGEIVEVTYRGDAHRLRREVGQGETVPANLPGNEVFQATNQEITGGRTIANPGDPLSSEGLPSSQGYFRLDDTKIYYDTTTDSLNDIRDRINNKGIGVRAEVTGSGELKLSSRTPHEIFLKDFDRSPETSSNQVQGLLNDLEILGDDSSPPGPPAPRSEPDFPNPYHQNATVEGKSVFDALVDLREAMQPAGDADAGTIPEGNATTNRSLDPPTQQGAQQALSDLRRGLNNVVANRSKGGALVNRMESANVRNEDFQVNTKSLISQLEDANLAEVVTDFRRQQTVQQAALRMSGQVMNLSLASFV